MKYFKAETWFEIGENMKKNIVSGFEGVANGVIGILNKVISGFESLLNTIPDAINSMLDKFGDAGLTEIFGIEIGRVGTISIPRIPMFATGGFPEDGLFMANHNELVGKFSNGKTAVANNDQIVSGIELGVSNANDKVVSAIYTMTSAIVSAVSNGSKIEINGQEVFGIVRDEAYEYQKQYGEPAFG